MARISAKTIMDAFCEAFLQNEKLTSSQYRMQMFKLKNLRKSTKEFVEENYPGLEKSSDQVLLDCIEYAKDHNYKFKSIASLGYDVLPKSIEYYIKKEKLEKLEAEKEQTESIDDTSKLDDLIRKNNERLSQTKKVPNWLK